MFFYLSPLDLLTFFLVKIIQTSKSSHLKVLNLNEGKNSKYLTQHTV